MAATAALSASSQQTVNDKKKRSGVFMGCVLANVGTQVGDQGCRSIE
jgi:hypothetical protein